MKADVHASEDMSGPGVRPVRWTYVSGRIHGDSKARGKGCKGKTGKGPIPGMT